MKNECKRCGHTWLPRTETRTVQCPFCKSYKWGENKEDVFDIVKERERAWKVADGYKKTR